MALPSGLATILDSCRAKPDLSLSPPADVGDSRWVPVIIGQQAFRIKTSDLDAKHSAIDALFNLVVQMGVQIIPFCDQIIEAIIPLLKFYFSDHVRLTVMALLPILLQAARASGMPAGRLLVISTHFCNSISAALKSESTDPGNLGASLLTSWADCVNQYTPSPVELVSMIGLSQTLLQVIVTRHQTMLENRIEEEAESDVDELTRTLASISRVLRLLISSNPDEDWRPLISELIRWISPPAPPNPPNPLSIGLKRLGFRLLGSFIKLRSRPLSEELIARLSSEVLAGFDDRDQCIRGLAPFIVGLCAEMCDDEPELIHRQLIQSAIGPLVNGLKRHEEDTPEDVEQQARNEAAIVARENCVSAIAKIVRQAIEGIEIDFSSIADQWIEALPIEIDVEEVEASYGLLLELIARGHESVDPVKVPLKRIEKVIYSLVIVIENPEVNVECRNSLSIGLKTYVNQIPEEIQNIYLQGLVEPHSVGDRGGNGEVDVDFEIWKRMESLFLS